MRSVKVVLALGRLGFDAYCNATGVRGLAFGHWASYDINNRMLLASYHPSSQNSNTGKLTWEMWMQSFRNAKAILNDLA